ncbi:unnamed protein product [Plutella xylostella]|uniref:(diamondback moth) hypothetical protein n=1 Tax=Plutella xylostella TaxID=51655 RepID=A0A8S4G1H2_PLUXY|nr:unnamed protein product [Plutella xylostella]
MAGGVPARAADDPGAVSARGQPSERLTSVPRKQKAAKNVLTRLGNMEGPLAALKDCVDRRIRIQKAGLQRRSFMAKCVTDTIPNVALDALWLYREAETGTSWRRYDAFDLADKQTIDSARQRRGEVMSVALRGCARAASASRAGAGAVAARPPARADVRPGAAQDFRLL